MPVMTIVGTYDYITAVARQRAAKYLRGRYTHSHKKQVKRQHRGVSSEGGKLIMESLRLSKISALKLAAKEKVQS